MSNALIILNIEFDLTLFILKVGFFNPKHDKYKSQVKCFQLRICRPKTEK